MPRRPNLPRKFVAARHLALTLVYLDELFVRVSREDLRLLTRGSCVVLDKDSHLPTSSFNTNGERGCVEQEAFGLLRRVAAKETAAPKATAPPGLIDLFGSLPLKKSLTSFRMRGIRVEPPMRTISCMFDLSISESLSSFYTGSLVDRSG